MAISMGKANRYREMGIRGNVFPGNKILDAGSGFGNMSRIAAKLTDQQIEVVLRSSFDDAFSTRTSYQIR